MISRTCRHLPGTALVAMLVVVMAAGACSRKKPPATDTRIDTSGADTSAVRPSEPERAEDTRMARMDAARSVVAERIYFDFNRSEIKPEGRETLASKVDVLSEFPEISIRVEGHADERGTVEYNLALGEQRAQAAKDYLVNAGVDPDRAATISYGEERPAVDESNESAWSENRRDEFVITSGGGGF